MKTLKQSTQKILVLVPHRDIRRILCNYSDALFKAGFCGAYHFPQAAPLALLSQPLNISELKHCARALREAAGGSKINITETSVSSFPMNKDGMEFFGPRLNIDVSAIYNESSSQKITGVISAPVICACLLRNDETDKPSLPAPKFSFSAAAVANMLWQPLGVKGVQGYKWKIGELIWLAPVKKKGQ